MTTVGSGADRAVTVEVTDLRKAYAGRPVLQGVSFEVGAGEIFALLGPNGAGKTTTVEIIEGYRRPDRGAIRVLGFDPARAGRAHRARVGLMLQGGGGIDPRMTAREVVALHARFHADPRPVDPLLEVVGLTGATARTRYRRLSGGERQRVGLALALVGNPELAVLDEPTAGMDVEARAATRDVLSGLRSNGVSVLLTSHDLADVERLADRLAILDRGRIVAAGSPDELTVAAAPVLRFRLGTTISESDLVDLGRALGSTVVDEGSARYRVEGAPPTPSVVAALAGWCSERGALIVELRTGAGSLEERYLELIGAAARESVDEDEPSEPAARRRKGRA